MAPRVLPKRLTRCRSNRDARVIPDRPVSDALQGGTPAMHTLAPFDAGDRTLAPEVDVGAEWRCLSCGKLLGVHRGGRVHVRVSRGDEFLAPLPVLGLCRRCGTLNEVATPTETSPTDRN